jgi:hypothetical protein
MASISLNLARIPSSTRCYCFDEESIYEVAVECSFLLDGDYARFIGLCNLGDALIDIEGELLS